MTSSGRKTRVRERVPLGKRKRASVACRQTKSKCMGGYPCKFCQDNNLECKIVPLRNKVRSESENYKLLDDYVRKLENIIQYLIPNISRQFLKNHVNIIERIIVTNDGKFILSKADVSALEEKYKDHRIDEEIPHHSPKKYLGPDHSQNTDSNETPKELTLEELNYTLDSSQKFIPSFGINCLLHALKVLPDDNEVIRLTDTFFTVCETNYHYVNYLQFLQELPSFLLAKEKGHLNTISENWKFLIILLGLLATASGYEYLIKDESLATFAPSVVGIEDPGIKYYRACIPFIDDLIACHDIPSAQGLLLIGIFLTTYQVNEETIGTRLYSPSTDSGYDYIRMATEVAIYNKLHMIRDINHANDESNLRFWWSCYCLERRYGINIGQRGIIGKDEILSQLPSDCIELRRPDGSSNYLHQYSMIKLMFIIDQIFITLQASPSWGGRDRYVKLEFSAIKKLLTMLELWKSQSQSSLSSVEIDPKAYLYRAHMHLYLNYLLARLYLGKPFLLFKVESIKSKKDLSSEENTFINLLTSICADAAFKIIEQLVILQKNQKLGLYSSTDLNFCTLGLFVLILFLKIDKSSSTTSFFQKGLDVLRTLSMGCEAAKVAYGKFQSIQAVTVDDPPELQVNDRISLDLEELDLFNLGNFVNDNELEFYQEAMDSLKIPRVILDLEPSDPHYNIFGGGCQLRD